MAFTLVLRPFPIPQGRANLWFLLAGITIVPEAIPWQIYSGFKFSNFAIFRIIGVILFFLAYSI